MLNNWASILLLIKKYLQRHKEKP